MPAQRYSMTPASALAAHVRHNLALTGIVARILAAEACARFPEALRHAIGWARFAGASVRGPGRRKP